MLRFIGFEWLDDGLYIRIRREYSFDCYDLWDATPYGNYSYY
jgi:hypothetical protein